MATVVAELKRATKTYGEITALQDVSLQIRSGEVVAVLGPNGAGKTTAVNLMLGLLRPTQGEARLFGLAPNDVRARMRTGAMLQLSGVPQTLKVRELIELFSSYHPNPLDLHETLELSNLTSLAGRLYGKLSGGQQQRLHFALAICGNPDLLFLDEPTAGLDVASRRALWEQLRGFIGRGRSVVLTIHYLEEADALADRIVVLHRGRVKAEGSPGEIKARTAGRKLRAVTTLGLESLRTLAGVASARRDGGRAIAPELAAEAWSEPDPLSDRERQVLRLAGEGYTSGEIADLLGLAEGTVRNYLSEAISKMGVSNRIEAARLARERGGSESRPDWSFVTARTASLGSPGPGRIQGVGVCSTRAR